MRVLGVDPGTLVVGYGCLEVADAHAARRGGARIANLVDLGAGGMRVVEAGVLRLGGKRLDLAERLRSLADQMGALLDRLVPQELALEQAFLGKSVHAALRIGEARGVVLAEAGRRGIRVHHFAPARVKRAVAGHGTAGKDAVAEMARRLLALDRQPSPRDVSDALAVAITRVEALRWERATGGCIASERDV